MRRYKNKMGSWLMAHGSWFIVVAISYQLSAISYDSLAGDKIAIDRNQPITITSNSMEARKKENLVIFKGDVKAEQKDYTLYSKELYVYYADGQQIKEMIATGDVKIVQANKMATGEKAVYTREDRTVVLTGNPQVEQDCDSVKGDKITIFLDEDKSLVEGSVKAVVNPKNEKTKAKCRQ
ncbi:MAG: lipopolysaccharide transport periplasmic protein LptA [Deltaproteobacteria bacterium]|nr:lipopolysaccharide transport periplasmic protein LptA [Deltaproteobacteria bacterium]